ncbi:MAG TPA: hypothetical protein VNX47_12625 [Nevskia sp.]|jgi:hypothetical protein|nr:hypothetical protein [Nevskia sp.]
MDVLKKTAFVLALAVFGAGLSACNKNQDAGKSAPSNDASSPAAAGPGYGASSSGGSSSSSSGG